MKKLLKTLLIILVIAFILIQFIRPEKNSGQEIAANQIVAVQHVPDSVQQIFKTACNDCHSNTTQYPWYSKIQPMAWFLDDHIVEGKKELNFSVFAKYTVFRRYKKLKEIGKEVKDGDMPIFSYTFIHRDALLNDDQKLLIENWVANAVKEMEAKYPADSLVRPK